MGVFMSRLSAGDLAPNFSLPDHRGELLALSDVLQSRNALLVFNLGFV